MSKPEITYESWIEDLRREENPDGFSAADVARQSGKSRDQVSAMLRRLWERGEIEFVGKRRAQAMDGTMRAAPVYRFVKKARTK